MSRIQIEKLQFIGESVGLNEYEAACTLAEDCDLRAGLLVPRFDDVRETTQTAERACMVDVEGGTLRWRNSTGFCFVWGDEAFFLNSSGSWVKDKADGSQQILNEPPTPSACEVLGTYFHQVLLYSTEGTWNVAPNPDWPPTWSNISGSISRTFNFTSSKNWSGAHWLWGVIEVPSGADPTFRFYVNNTEVPGRFVRGDNTFGWLIWDVSGQDMSNVTSLGFSYYLGSSHTLVFRYFLDVEYSVPAGPVSYVVTVERGGVESGVSPVATKIVRSIFKEIPTTGVSVQVTVSGGQGGDKLRLYRAVEGQYVLVAERTMGTTYSTATLNDKGDKSEGLYRPSGKLPYGPAIVSGNRVVIASGRVVWVSQAGEPTRFGATAINEDNQDAFSVVLPAATTALAPAEGGVVVHTRRGQYFIRLTPSYDNDIIHARPPEYISDHSADNFKSATAGAFVDEGRLFVDGQLIASGLPRDAWLVRAGGRIYHFYQDTCLVWSSQEWQGALRSKLPDNVNWAFAYGDSVFVATNNGIYKVAASANRKASCRWRTGKRFMPMLSAIRFVHLAGSGTVKLIRPGKPDVVLSDISGRVNVPSSEQTHEWMLELNVAQSDAVYQCYISYESGIQ